VQLQEKPGSSAGYFEDREFPATALSVARGYKNEQVQWKRAGDFCNRATFGKYVEPNDFQVGTLSCPSFLSVLSCLAERERNIKRLIENQQLNPNGFYLVRLNINGVWRYISVDDFLPTINDENVGTQSFRDSESEISISIIEKAYAKAYNGYSVFFRKSKPEHYLRDLTGSRVVQYGPTDKDFASSIKHALDQSWTVIAVPTSKIEELGLNHKFNLGITGLSNRGLELRNSWGTMIEKPKITLSKEGLFEISLQDAVRYLDYVLVA
jgi:calpain-15